MLCFSHHTIQPQNVSFTTLPCRFKQSMMHRDRANPTTNVVNISVVYSDRPCLLYVKFCSILLFISQLNDNCTNRALSATSTLRYCDDLQKVQVASARINWHLPL